MGQTQSLVTNIVSLINKILTLTKWALICVDLKSVGLLFLAGNFIAQLS
jgi:hypothetical protein